MWGEVMKWRKDKEVEWKRRHEEDRNKNVQRSEDLKEK